jgi:hypothetical protein
LDYVIHTINRVIDSLHNDRKSPEERCTGVQPDLSIARPFDAPCWNFIYKEERMKTGAVFRPHVRMGRMVGYDKIVPGSYLVMDHDGSVRSRLQVYCKEYPVLVGLESLKSKVDPIDDDGKILEYEVDNQSRMQRDSELMRQSSKLPADRHGNHQDDDNKEGYWSAADLLERPKTRAKAKEREARARLAEVNLAVAALVRLGSFELPETPKSMEESLAGPDAEHWQKGREKELKGISDRGTWEDLESTGVRTQKTRRTKKPITSKWALRVSWNPDGTIKYRCRIIARFFLQLPGADYICSNPTTEDCFGDAGHCGS